MTRNRVMLLLIVALLSGWQSAGAISFEGNHVFSDDDLARLVEVSIPDDSIAGRVKSLYRENGYFNAEVKVVSSNSHKGKKAVISEGAPATIDSVGLEISPASDEIPLADLLREIKGAPASQEILDGFASVCVERMAEYGMPYASATWRDFRFNGAGNVIATLTIASGPVTYISGVEFNGIKRTRPATLAKTINLRPGQKFSEHRLQECESLIDQMPYLGITEPFALRVPSDAESSVVVFNVKELPSTRFDGAGGLVPSRNTSIFVGRLDLEFGDILGTGRSFGLLWNKRDRFSNELRLKYLEPFVLGSRMDMRLEAYQVDKDTSFIETGAAVGFARRLAGGFDAAVWFSLQRTDPETRSSVVGSTGRAVRFSIGYGKTDDSENPTSGYGMTTSVNYKYRSNRQKGPENLNLPTRLTSAGLDARFFLKLSRRLVIATKLTGWGVVANDGRAPVDELRYLGGFDSLRGYAVGRFPAYRYAMATLEPRLISGRYSRIYVFTDLAEIKSSQDVSSPYLFQPGYGLGVVAPSPLGQFKIEVGWGKTDFPSHPVFNFGVAGAF